MRTGAALAAVWTMLGAACGGGPAPPDAVAALCTDQAPAAPTFANVQVLFTSCTACHTNIVPLDLDPDVSYANLVGKAPPSYTNPLVDETCGGVLVMPGDPAASYLYQKLTQPTPCAGSQMPLSEFGVPTPLPACYPALIHDWIAAGAPND